MKIHYNYEKHAGDAQEIIIILQNNLTGESLLSLFVFINNCFPNIEEISASRSMWSATHHISKRN